MKLNSRVDLRSLNLILSFGNWSFKVLVGIDMNELKAFPSGEVKGLGFDTWCMRSCKVGKPRGSIQI